MALLEDLTAKVAELGAPIPGDSPVGTDISYEPDFVAVKAEIEKLSAVGGGTPHWSEVIAKSEELLKTRSKDMRLAAWLAVARLRTSGPRGLAEGLTAIHAVSTSFWDGMYPDARRARARGNLVNWLSEQATQQLLTLEPAAGDGESLKTLETLYGQLDDLFTTKLGDAYSGMGQFRSVLRDKLRQVPAPAAPPPAATPTPTAAPTNGAAADAAPATATAPAARVDVPAPPAVTGADDAIAALRAVGKTICDAARHLRKADPAQPWPYRLQRTGAWLVVRAAPPAEGKTTRIPAPPADQRKKLETLLSGERWMELLNAAEDLTGTFLFWLDLHRFVALAMDRLGALLLAPREVVGRELVGFVDRFPAVVGLTFADGTPFVDASTQTFIEEERAKWAPSGASAGSSRMNEEDEELAKRFAEAKELTNGGKVSDGLALAAQLASRGADARARFRARLSVAQLAVSGGKPELARPMLEGLVLEADRHGLEDWEPGLCASVYAVLLACKKPDTPANKEEWSKIFDRLCRLDPSAALKIAG